MERFCRKCNKDISEPFCPDCGGLAVSKGLIRQSGTSKKGERFEAAIWSGEELGIRIGVPNRDKFFSRKNDHVVLIIDDIHYSARVPNSFWSKCPEIRVASDSQHFNILQSWIERHGIQPQSAGKAPPGGKDAVMLEVVEPEVSFRLMVPPPASRDTAVKRPEPPSGHPKPPPSTAKAQPGPIQEQWKAVLPAGERPPRHSPAAATKTSPDAPK